MSTTTQVSRSIAPWAEVVPGWGPVTVDTLLTLPDDAYIYEVVEGVLVRMAGSGEEASSIAAGLIIDLGGYVRQHHLGIVTGADGVYKFPDAETGLLPDVGFYRADRRTLITDRRKPMPFPPDLAVEVASPDQSAKGMAAKARLYLSGGTRLVWIVWPSSQHIDVWRAGHPGGPMVSLHAGDALVGEDLIPGFSLPVADVFADPLS